MFDYIWDVLSNITFLVLTNGFLFFFIYILFLYYYISLGCNKIFLIILLLVVLVGFVFGMLTGGRGLMVAFFVGGPIFILINIIMLLNFIIKLYKKFGKK